MNRKIKFRAWDKEENKMWEVIAIHFHDGNLDVELQNKEDNKNFSHKTISYVKDMIMQYTGLKDKNGKEIYEGDIIRFVNTNFPSNMYCEVKYEISSFILVREYNTMIDLLYYIDTDNIEVIGNIFENPELLKQD